MTRSYQAELRQLVAEVIRMGGLAEAQVVDAVDAVVRRDVPLAQALIVRDLRLDTLQSEVEHRALALISHHHPGEADLRRAISTLKLAMNLERCGDLARNIAKRSLVLSAGEIEPALDVWRRDGEVDEHYESLFRELLHYMSKSPDAVAAGAHLLFVAKNLERIGDHATNIAEILHFQMTGEELTGERPKLSLPDLEAEARGA